MASIEWMAGFFDGEGCVGVKSPMKRGKYIYEPFCMVVNTVRHSLVPFQETFGGNIFHRDHANENHRDTYNWQLNKREDLVLFLETIKPFLVVKQEQAELMLEFFTLTSKWTRRTDEILEQQRVIYLKLQELKRT